MGSVTVRGADNLERTLDVAARRITDLAEPNRESAQLVAVRARSTAPVGPSTRGHVSSTVRVGADETEGVVSVGDNGPFRYAGVIHWGWPAHNIAPNPWVSRALEASEPGIVREFEDYVSDVVSDVKGI